MQMVGYIFTMIIIIVQKLYKLITYMNNRLVNNVQIQVSLGSDHTANSEKVQNQ